MDTKKLSGWLVSLVLVGSLVSGGAVALWLAAIAITGTMTSPGGSQPSPQTFVVDFVNTPVGNTTETFSFVNDDGLANYIFVCNLTASSTDGLCNVEDGEDYNLYINGMPCSIADNPTVAMTNGDNLVNVTLAVDSRACPATGSLVIDGSLI